MFDGTIEENVDAMLRKADDAVRRASDQVHNAGNSRSAHEYVLTQIDHARRYLAVAKNVLSLLDHDHGLAVGLEVNHE